MFYPIYLYHPNTHTHSDINQHVINGFLCWRITLPCHTKSVHFSIQASSVSSKFGPQKNEQHDWLYYKRPNLCMGKLTLTVSHLLLFMRMSKQQQQQKERQTRKHDLMSYFMFQSILFRKQNSINIFFACRFLRPYVRFMMYVEWCEWRNKDSRHIYWRVLWNNNNIQSGMWVSEWAFQF